MFNDRFILSNPDFENIDIKNTKESVLLSMSGELQRMVDSIRRVDATLSRAPVFDIYYVVTEYSDPKIGGILASAKDVNTNERIFDSLEIVKQVMFSEFENIELNIFNDTIRQSSVTLAASRLVGNLAPAGENFRGQAQFLHDNAVKDVERIVQSIDVSNLSSSDDKEVKSSASLYFVPYEIHNIDSLKVEVYLSGLNNTWENVKEYTTSTSTAEMVTDIADYINSQTLVSQESNILAAATLNAEQNYHTITFDTRRLSSSVSTSIISIRFTLSNTEFSRLPFKWGANLKYLNDYNVNSILIATGEGTTGVKNLKEEERDLDDITVLYFRRKITGLDSIDYTKQRLKYRVNPTQTEYITEVFPYSIETEKERPLEAALSLLDSLSENQESTKLVGAISRSDPLSVDRPITGLELVGYKLMNTNVFLILDLLEIPEDIEVAIGDIYNPITRFSNMPRSIKIKTLYDLSNMTPAAYREESGKENKPRIISRPASSFFNQIRSKTDYWEYTHRKYR